MVFHLKPLKIPKLWSVGRRVNRGEVPERNLYKALQAYFQGKEETVAVFHGIDILKLNLEKVKVNEKDFVIINATHQYIPVVEVKNHLGAAQCCIHNIGIESLRV